MYNILITSYIPTDLRDSMSQGGADEYSSPLQYDAVSAGSLFTDVSKKIATSMFRVV